MTLVLNVPALVEPITLAEAKAHLRVDSPAEDVLIAALISTSRLQIEAALSLSLIDQSWSLFLDDWPPPPQLIVLPVAPVRTLTALRTYAADDTPTAHAVSHLQLDPDLHQPRVHRRQDTVATAPRRPMNGIEIAFLAGFGPTPADVPAPLRQALLQLTAHWFEHRGGVADAADARIPAGISTLLTPWRRSRLA
jgi:uncharacterized phiE125 gp8 family phage protein